MRALIQKYKPARRLGVAGARKYDLPLHNDSGSGFLRLLLALMALLTVLALTASFALGALQARWEGGLRGQFTVEIPAAQKSNIGDAIDLLISHPAIESAEAMSEEDIHGLLSPWLGDDWQSGDLPLPGIISVKIQNDAALDLDALENRLNKIAQGARIDAHESWLADVMRFTGALTLAASLLTAVVVGTVIVAVIGGVRTRMEIHREELQLLHLMGASDPYIARQLMRHSFFLALQGALCGTAMAILVILLTGWAAGQLALSLLPGFHLTGAHWMALLACPLALSLMAMFTARVTALRELARMP